MSNKTSPKIKKPVVPPRKIRGSLNSPPLSKRNGDKKAVSRSYDEIAELSGQLDALKKEYGELEEALDSMINSETLTPFCQFKKWEMELNQRLSEREAELSAFSKYLGSFRKEPDPTFVEVDAAKMKEPRFDSITASLLVANPERTFFNNGDLAERNNELHTLILQQGETLNLLKSRLMLFTKYQHANSAAAAVESLKKGEIPMALLGSAPTKSAELKTKKKVLAGELASLIEVRKELMAAKWQKRLEVRKYKHTIRMAIVIQRVFRGYLVRLRMKTMKEAATKIQSAWRGYFVRYKQARGEAYEETNPRHNGTPSEQHDPGAAHAEQTEAQEPQIPATDNTEAPQDQPPEPAEDLNQDAPISPADSGEPNTEEPHPPTEELEAANNPSTETGHQEPTEDVTQGAPTSPTDSPEPNTEDPTQEVEATNDPSTETDRQEPTQEAQDDDIHLVHFTPQEDTSS